MALATEPIAIIGSACRFPGGSSSPSKLWDLLKQPRDVLRDFPGDRLALSNFYNPNGNFHGSTDVQNKSYLLDEDVRLFDASFFHINAVEAEGMDPAQRILLEAVYEAVEAAGAVKQIKGSQTSVFVGLMTADWWDLQMRDTETLPTYAATGTARSMVANRISYFFDLKGASMTIDTACSSSLVALHQAVQSLRRGESTTAIVAGANLIFDPAVYISESKLHMLSPDSRSRMWDKGANGYARGEGCAAVLLKPLSQAIADGDDIESIVRETGVNSDGRTPGITMPSAAAQADLIRQTYRNAGLDPAVDRCQYFECHGTGTAAGDPIEARAIADVFECAAGEKIYVGSVKTLIGHLEGCSGLAGVIKTSLALQHRTLTPNLLFEELNPAIEPYYKHLEVVQSPTPWPQTSGVRRASVNSFGFGGTNAHAILESYDAETPEQGPRGSFQGPLLFSACSSSSLIAQIRDFASYIQSNPSVDLENMAWLLQQRRSVFDVKHFFSAPTREALFERMHNYVESTGPADAGTNAQLLYPDDPPAILGVFTGQGAQWATMGASLIKRSRLFCESIERSEAALAVLPHGHGPSWSLKAELLAPKETSRLSEAALSQPLCTALQIALVDLATASGLVFNATVGHSSGEIAAAYAAGIISATDAMAIAYYRGYHTTQAPAGVQGGMLAVSLSYDAAREFCMLPQWVGRICPAASNSPSSVTLSGDLDAIHGAKAHFDGEKIFARQLQVDKAYHSHHMLPCAPAYLESLKACNITVNQPRPGCTWCSSVVAGTVLEGDDLEALSAQYWVDNMVNPVLFSDAVENSIWNGGPFELAVEIGPHPALKGPVTQVLKLVLDSSPPYVGLLHRGDDAVEAFSNSLGLVWSLLGPAFVDFEGYRNAFTLVAPRLLKCLPSYSWDHDKPYWKESRISRNYRLRKNAPHELLGRRVADDTDQEMRWRNILRLNEIPWMRGHKFQGQVLFPAAAHVVMAIEASKHLAASRPVKLIELKQVCIHHSVVLEESSHGVETTFTLKVLASRKDTAEAEFSSYTFVDEATGASRKTVSGQIILHLGDSPDAGLPSVERPRCHTSRVDLERFYSSMERLGLGYEGLFKGLTQAERTRDHARTVATWQSQDSKPSEYLVHPALLDLAFQTNLLPLASPTTSAVGTLYLPTTLQRIIIDPARLGGLAVPGGAAKIDSFVTQCSPSSMTGDIHILDSAGAVTSMQIEGLFWKVLSDATPANDRQLFSRTVWDVDVANGTLLIDNGREDHKGRQLISIMERTALFNFQELVRSVSPKEISTFSWHHQRLFEAIEAKLKEIHSGKNTIIQQAWLEDERETIDRLQAQFPDQIELVLMHAISKELTSVVRGEAQILEVMLQDNMLNRFYMESAFAQKLNFQIARVVGQISFKYPRAKFLEIGAGTGGTTRSILDTIGSSYSSYTYTDMSSGFFQKAADKFSDHSGKMAFKVLDIEKEVTSQGYQEEGYDVVVAANVLHATHNLGETLQHARSLLKPGGYLVLMEATGDALAATYIMGALPGWWLGVDDGRRFHPGVSVGDWDGLLQRAGFSGVDGAVYDCPDLAMHTFSVLISQAVDDTVKLLRNPLSAPLSFPQDHLVLIGGTSPLVAKLRRDVQALLPHWGHVTVVDTLDALDAPSGCSVICLTELDRPLFAEAMTQHGLQKVQRLFAQAHQVLWLTNGEHALSRMVVGLGRSLPSELPHLALQFLDTKTASDTSPVVTATAFLRLVMANQAKSVKMLWTTEPEMKMEGTTMLVPRIVPDKAMNERFNAARRLVTHKVTRQSTRVELATDDATDRLNLYDAGPLEESAIYVQYSTALDEKCFLCLGTLQGTSTMAFAVSHHDATSICVPQDRVFALPDGPLDSPALLLLEMASHVIAWKLVQLVPSGCSALVYDPTVQLATAIRFHAAAAAKDVFFATSKVPAPKGWLPVHPHVTQRALRAIVPESIRYLIDLGQSSPAALASSLPHGSAVHRGFHVSADASVLEAVFPAVTQNSLTWPAAAIVDVQSLAGAACSSRSYPIIVDWTQTELTIAVEPLDATSVLRPDRTYLLVGLTGDMGRSLCRWMVDNGARNIVLTSRSMGDIDAAWLEQMSSLGATIKVYKMDVADRGSVYSICETIKATLPPIAGVCNAAMVLEDKLFVDMTAETLNKVLAPKVEGSKILDDLFGDDEALDFFVLFSSLASTFGNAGQSNYHAANLFVQGLCACRRARGLAASVMHVGFVTDVGYVARSGRRFKEHLSKLSLQLMSETDLHHLFGEAIVNSRPGPPDAERSWDIIAGIDPFVDDDDDPRTRPPFYSNPRFAHFVHDSSPSSAKNGTSRRHREDDADVKQRLLVLHRTPSPSQQAAVQAAVQTAFATALEEMLQMAPGSLKPNNLLTSVGLDSLIAIEIRAWFRKALGLDVPVLRILKGDSVALLCADIAKGFLLAPIE